MALIIPRWQPFLIGVAVNEPMEHSKSRLVEDEVLRSRFPTRRVAARAVSER